MYVPHLIIILHNIYYSSSNAHGNAMPSVHTPYIAFAARGGGTRKRNVWSQLASHRATGIEKTYSQDHDSTRTGHS